MVYVDSFAWGTAVSVLNGAGVVAAANVWSALLAHRYRRLLPLAAAIAFSAWLQTALSMGVSPDTGTPTPFPAQAWNIGKDILAWAILSGIVFWLRRFLITKKSKASPLPLTLNEEVQVSLPIDLRSAVERFLTNADNGNAAQILATYHPEFACIRVADEGGYAHLSRTQMATFWSRPERHIVSTASGGKSGIPTRETVIHFAEVEGDTGYALLTRVKDLGKGWEPLFYCLVWKRLTNNSWSLWREFVHQRSVPDWK